MGTPSLLQLSRRMCVRVVKDIRDVGLAPYELIRPILQKIENPEHLHELELKSPHLMEYDSELWIEYIKRDVPRWREIDLPERPQSWYNVYTSLLEQVAKELEEDAIRMARALRGLDKEKSKHSSQFVDERKMQLLRLPKEKPTSVQKYAHHDRIMGGIRPTYVLNTDSSSEGRGRFAGDSNSKWRLQPPKLRQAAPKKSALPIVKRNSRLCVPTHQLNRKASQVTKVAKSLVDTPRPLPPPRKLPPPGNTTTGRPAPLSRPRIIRPSTTSSPFLIPKPRVSKPIETKPSPTMKTPPARNSPQQHGPTIGQSPARAVRTVDAPAPQRSMSKLPSALRPTPRKRAAEEEKPLDSRQKRLKVV
ncbi:hypothetical protein FQN57_002804 [Myotisia sp. PD_48]|nr:hypothetical protein FQN57_002804 [Myotisia sp. PD_48]